MTTRAELQKEIAELEVKVRLADSVKQLKANAQFKDVVIDNYMTSYPIEIVNKLCLYPQDSADYKELVAELDAISRFNHYFESTITEGQLSEADLKFAKAIPDSELD